MKTIFPTRAVAVFFAALALTFVSCNSKKAGPATEPEETITISGAFALYPLVVKWADEFKKLHPNITFEISAGGSGKGISDALGGLVDLGAVSRDLKPEELSNGAYPVAVAKDAVVPTYNTSNPNSAEIASKGMTKEFFQKIFAGGTVNDWKQAGFSHPLALHVYTRSDASGAGETWAKYVGVSQEDLAGIGVFGDPGLLQSVQHDAGGIGYNNIAYVYDAATGKPFEGIRPIPVDVNANGKIDSEENFYATPGDLAAAIRADKYPTPPARNLYFVSKGKPQRKAVRDFLQWILSNGQKFVEESGYIGLKDDQLKTEQNKFSAPL